MPQAFTCDGTEGQRTKKIYEKDLRYVKELSFTEGLEHATVASVIYGSSAIAGQFDYLTHGYDILIV